MQNNYLLLTLSFNLFFKWYEWYGIIIYIWQQNTI